MVGTGIQIGKQVDVHCFQIWSIISSNRLEHAAARQRATHRAEDIRFEVGLGIAPTDADSLKIPVYTALHRIRLCGNETIRRK